MNFKNYKTAAMIMGLMIAAAVFLGGSKAVIQNSDQVESIYIQQLQLELERQSQYAASLIVLAKNENKDKNLIDQLETDLNIFNEVSAKHEKYIAFVKLQSSFDALKISMVGQMSLTENERLLNQIYQNFYSAYDLISRSKENYNQAAKKWNEELTHFPISIFKEIVGKGNAELFA